MDLTQHPHSAALSEALAAQWVRAQPVLTAYITSMVGDLSIAEDIAQEVAVAATRQYTQAQHDRPFMPWVFGIARNQVALHLRKKYNQPVMFDTDIVDQVQDAFLRVASDVTDRRSALAECLKRLSPKAYELIELRYTQGVKPRQIAEQTGTSANTVSVALCRIRKTLGDCIDRRLAKGESR
ncbi:MAG: sigma-70 family RNA polymerase sigma factor [Phycisphaerales bacterium JB063]